MISLFDYGKDGAGSQARAVLAYIQSYEGIENSFDSDKNQFVARPTIARWENCREQGYVISMNSHDYTRQINIAFFEHRNNDNIVSVKWEQVTLNSPNINTAEFGNIYKTKYDVSCTKPYGKASEMADWIIHKLEKFWVNTKKGDKK